MTKLILRRLVLSVFILLAVSVLVFCATLLLPGDPARAILGQQATPERIAALNAQLNLDQPAVVRYFLWLGGLFVGDFGMSTAFGGPVSELLGERITASLVLMVLAALVSIPVGLFFGIWSALHRGGRRDRAVTWVSLTLAALPEFVIGIALVTIFATSVFQILPAVTMAPPGTPVWAIPSQLILPTITLALVVAPYIARM
ncbi:MAG TPA: ABC transporter permease, partial [Brevibacterium sp.]|nr:ABC transporter permease [Brevibacterium sp.]